MEVAAGVPGHCVIGGLDRACARSLIDSISLCAVVSTRFSNLVSFDNQISGIRLDVKAISFARVAIIKNLITAKDVAAATVL